MICTSHISIGDHEQNAVSMTTTVNAYFGLKKLSSSIGIFLNNEMDDFSMPANASKGVFDHQHQLTLSGQAKRPLLSMSPTIVLKDNQLTAVVNANGGSFISTATGVVLLNNFVRRMDLLLRLKALAAGYLMAVKNRRY
ncbi:Gamma-glutamyltranspeptidase [Parasponia andersonii]|uniref:Gamma-glutamyltranspeptidase n=1 Tax=Parasponia andersonii TaxID=3476 RepID=A0A2P5A8C4_PARAD|nr:Gamma-glutamyltranspeptidase [Parasponia andersonii]